ncbi:hypothetical protein EMIT0357P_10426 [Pseudomonas marginalis]
MSTASWCTPLLFLFWRKRFEAFFGRDPSGRSAGMTYRGWMLKGEAFTNLSAAFQCFQASQGSRRL